ncbi:MAG: hypothetical protein ACR2G6_11200 [Gemmatimonadaceae bacterium]
MKSGRCRGKNSRGQACGMPRVGDSLYCFTHAPERAQDRAKARKQGGHNRQTPNAPRGVLEAVHLRDVTSIQELLERVTADTLIQENSERRSRAMGGLMGIALRALEVGELEERAAALEQRLSKPRRFA